jgi:hypothetical protein
VRLRRKTRYKSGFKGTFSWPWLLGVLAVGELASFLWPVAGRAGIISYPRWVDGVAAAGLAALTALIVIRQRRSSWWRIRQELKQAAEARKGGEWLNRDEHQAFAVNTRWWRWIRIYMINRVPEDDAAELLSGESGEDTLAVETFVIIPGDKGVIRHDQVLLIDPETAAVRPLPSPGMFRYVRQLHKSSKDTGFGFVFADPAQIAEVVRQLRGSEPMGSPENGKGV